MQDKYYSDKMCTFDCAWDKPYSNISGCFTDEYVEEGETKKDYVRYFCEKEKYYRYQYKDEKCTEIKSVNIEFL